MPAELFLEIGLIWGNSLQPRQQRSHDDETHNTQDEKSMNDNSPYIIRCPNCNAANRIPAERFGKAAKCGKCHAELPSDKKAAEAQAHAVYKMRCTECGAKNRVPGEKLNAGAKCGKCGANLKTEELFTPQPIMISDGNFDSMVLKSPLPVLMWAWAPW